MTSSQYTVIKHSELQNGVLQQLHKSCVKKLPKLLSKKVPFFRCICKRLGYSTLIIANTFLFIHADVFWYNKDSDY